jgi:hypothetical protein
VTTDKLVIFTKNQHPNFHSHTADEVQHVS